MGVCFSACLIFGRRVIFIYSVPFVVLYTIPISILCITIESNYLLAFQFVLVLVWGVRTDLNKHHDT